MFRSIQIAEMSRKRSFAKTTGIVLTLLLISLAGTSCDAFAQAATKTQDPPIPVRYTDIRKAAGITFVQDSTQTDEKYYLETMGTGVAWIDYDQDGLMDLDFVQSGRDRYL